MKLVVIPMISALCVLNSLPAFGNGNLNFTMNIALTNTLVSFKKLRLSVDKDDANCVKITLPDGSDLYSGSTAKVKVQFTPANCNWVDHWNAAINHSAKLHITAPAFPNISKDYTVEFGGVATDQLPTLMVSDMHLYINSAGTNSGLKSIYSHDVSNVGTKALSGQVNVAIGCGTTCVLK